MTSRREATTVLLAAFALFAITRIHDFPGPCLWFDEIFSVHAATQPAANFLRFIALDVIHPPLFYGVLRLWIAIGGESVTWLRLLPTLLTAAAIVPAWLALRELRQNLIATSLALSFFIFSGQILKYSLEVRMYAQLLFLGAVAMYLTIRCINRGTGFWLLAFADVLLTYTHYFGWLIVLSQIVAFLVLRRDLLRSLAFPLVSVAALFVPWVIFVLLSREDHFVGQNIGWIDRPGPRELSVFALNFFEPMFYRTVGTQPYSTYLISIPLALSLAAAVVLFVYGHALRSEADRRAILLGFVSIFIPTVAAFLLSWLSPYSIWGNRHLIAVLLPGYIVVAVAVGALPTLTRYAVVAAVSACFAGAGLFALTRVNAAPSWCSINTFVEEMPSSDVPIYAVEDLTAYHAWFAARRGQKSDRVYRLQGIPGTGEDVAYFLPRGFEDVRRVEFPELTEERFWLVFRRGEIKDSEPPVRDLLVKGYRVSERKLIDAGGEKVASYLLER